MLTCPECQSDNEEDAPFCENCGYRFHDTSMPVSTLLEGLSALSADIAPSDHLFKDDPADLATSVDHHDHGEARTVLEGLSAIEPDISDDDISATITDPGVDNDSDLQKDSPTPDKKTYAPPFYHPSLIRYLMGFTFLWCILGMIAVGAIYAGAHATPDLKADQHKAHQALKSQIITISKGNFIRGLSEETRAFILQACMRMSPDPNEFCDQKKLLKNEYPMTHDTLPAYKIDAYEVTHAKYAQCVKEEKCPPLHLKACRVYTHQGFQVALRVPKALTQPYLPVVCVNYDQAKAYCKSQGGTLPTHDQWEKAARGGDDRPFVWGAIWSSDAANWAEADIIGTPVLGSIDGFEWTAPPGQFVKDKSPYGVYDMAGNISEWVISSDKSTGEARGGSWTKNPFDLRTTARMAAPQNHSRTDVGFRCVY